MQNGAEDGWGDVAWDADVVVEVGPKDIPLGEVEFRVSTVYVVTTDAHAVYPVDPFDVHDEWSRRIIEATHKVVAAHERVSPGAIRELGGIPQHEIDARVRDYDSSWLQDMDLYVRRIQAEGFRTRVVRTYRDGHSTLLRIPWREVEKTHAKSAQTIIQTQIGGVGGKEDDVGAIWESLTTRPREEYAPLRLPWPWLNAAIKGGMFKNKKYTFGAPPGHRKTSALFCAMHHAVMIEQKRWVHFAFDGGSIPEQTLKFAVLHWVHLLRKHDKSLECPADVFFGGQAAGRIQKYMYANTTVALKLLYGEETNCVFPDGALDLFQQMREDMRTLQAGKGPGLLVMVGAKAVGMDVYRVAQRLRNELYGRDGLDAWSLDHMGKPNNRYADDMQRIPENTRVLTGFTDMEGPPCILISQLSGKGVENIGKGEDVDPHLRYNPELYQDADGVIMFKYDDKTPDQLLLINQKNREGRGGPSVKYPLRVIPEVGYIWDDPIWASSALARRTSKRKKAEAELEDHDDE